jgi:16S rRNA (guanine966-N2)-methyltransferase
VGALRIVGGSLSGRRFGGKVSAKTRPTSDRVREAIASVIEARGGFEGARVLDLFAGTGALSFEALSRGATRALLIDSDAGAAREIGQSAASLGLASCVRAIAIDLRAAERASERIAGLGEGPFDRVFVDPPYAEAALVPPLLAALGTAGALAPSALVIVEHGTKTTVELGSPFEVVSRYRYGDTAVLLARWEPAAPILERSPR